MSGSSRSRGVLIALPGFARAVPIRMPRLLRSPRRSASRDHAVVLAGLERRASRRDRTDARSPGRGRSPRRRCAGTRSPPRRSPRSRPAPGRPRTRSPTRSQRCGLIARSLASPPAERTAGDGPQSFSLRDGRNSQQLGCGPYARPLVRTPAMTSSRKHVGVDEGELDVAEADAVAGAARDRVALALARNALAVDERAVGRARVLQQKAAVLVVLEKCVELADRYVADDHVVVARLADRVEAVRSASVRSCAPGTRGSSTAAARPAGSGARRASWSAAGASAAAPCPRAAAVGTRGRAAWRTRRGQLRLALEGLEAQRLVRLVYLVEIIGLVFVRHAAAVAIDAEHMIDGRAGKLKRAATCARPATR